MEPNPRSSTVDEGAAIIREKDLDLVIALGGGSPMDAANDTTGGYYGKQWEIKTLPQSGGTAIQDAKHTWDAGDNISTRQDDNHEQRRVVFEQGFYLSLVGIMHDRLAGKGENLQ